MRFSLWGPWSYSISEIRIPVNKCSVCSLRLSCKGEYETYGKPYPIFPPGRPTPKEVDGFIEVVTTGWLH